MLHISQLLDAPSLTSAGITSCAPLCWNSVNDGLPMNTDLRAMPSPSTSSSSTASGCSSATSPKQSVWHRSGNVGNGPMQYGNGLFREPDRMESGEKIKRPMNAFMVWSQIRRAQIANQDGKMHNSQISKELGIEWRKMNADQKAPYIQRSKDLRDELMRQHPDYVYRPKRKPRLRQKSPRSLSGSQGVVPSVCQGSETAITPTDTQTQTQAQQVATTQMLLAAAAQQQQSFLLAAYQAQIAAASKSAQLCKENAPITSDKMSDAVLKCQTQGIGLLAPSLGLLSYAGGLGNMNRFAHQAETPNMASALASFNSPLNPLLLAQLSSSFMMSNLVPNAHSQ